MMKSSSKTVSLTLLERCKNILAGNWRAHLNTIKADSNGSKDEIHTSKVHYMFRKGKPYIWIREEDAHNTNVIIDERGSLSVSSVIPGPLMSLLRSIKKFPSRVALSGDVIPLKEAKVQSITESLRESVLLENKEVSQAGYPVSALLTTASTSCSSRGKQFQEILEHSGKYAIYKFDIRTCTYVDGGGGTHDVESEDVDAPKSDLLAPFSEKLIDGINQSQARRRALMLFCFEYHNAYARDAVMLSVDRNGFDVLAKVPQVVTSNGLGQQYHWKEFRFTFKEEARDVGAFCRLLVELEEEALQSVKSYSGLG